MMAKMMEIKMTRRRGRRGGGAHNIASDHNYYFRLNRRLWMKQKIMVSLNTQEFTLP